MKTKLFVLSPPWGDYIHNEESTVGVEDCPPDWQIRFGTKILKILYSLEKYDVHWLTAREYSGHIVSHSSGAIIAFHPRDPQANPGAQFAVMHEKCKPYFEEHFNTSQDIFISLYQEQARWALENGARSVIEANLSSMPAHFIQKVQTAAGERSIRTPAAYAVYSSICSSFYGDCTMLTTAPGLHSCLMGNRSTTFAYCVAADASEYPADENNERVQYQVVGQRPSDEGFVIYYDGPRTRPCGIDGAVATLASLLSRGVKAKLIVSGVGVLRQQDESGEEIGPFKEMFSKLDPNVLERIIDLGCLSVADVMKATATAHCVIVPELFASTSAERFAAAYITQTPIVAFPRGIWLEINQLVGEGETVICEDVSHNSFVNAVHRKLEQYCSTTCYPYLTRAEFCSSHVSNVFANLLDNISQRVAQDYESYPQEIAKVLQITNE